MSFNVYALLTRIRRIATDALLSAAAFSTVTILPLLQVAKQDVLSSSRLWVHVVIYTAIAGAALAVMRTYRMIWRYVSFRDFLTLIGAVSLTLAFFIGFEFLFWSSGGPIPGTLLAWTAILIWTANIGFLATPRFVARAVSESLIWLRHRGVTGSSAMQILLTGDAVRMDSFLRECDRESPARYDVVGVLTENGQFHGSYLHGVQIIDSLDNLVSVLTRLGERGIRPHTLVYAKDEPCQAELSKLLELAATANIKLGRLSPTRLATDGAPVLPIDLSDLLARPEIYIDMSAVARLIEGKRVIVTGGGGSIGSELSRQIAEFKPAKLVVLDSCEFNLYSIDKELEERYPTIERQTALVDVRDAALVSIWVERVRPHIVFHAAALKHVPMLEEHTLEGIKTNVFGTINVAEACVANGVSAMVTISTDKAVNPTNAMGATKRLAEAYCQGLDETPEGNGATRFVTVRFGNVLGSAGSVVPLFQRQIEQGGPVTVTHPEITRFFMTIPEAVTLVLQAGAHGMGTAEERGNIYLLDMGEPVKIIDLARQMIRLSGARPDVDIKIKIIGLRPGEKLYEEVMHRAEAILPTASKSILKLSPRNTDLRIIRQQVQELKQACAAGDRERGLRLLRISVPDYMPSSERKATSA